MIKLTKLADYAVVLMSTIAEHPDRVHRAAEIAGETHIPAPTASKILGAMTRHGLLTSHRGIKGGFSLARAPQDITVADIIRAVDGPIALTDCVEHASGDCDIIKTCRVRGYWHRINAAVKAALDGVTLAEISAPVPDYMAERPFIGDVPDREPALRPAEAAKRAERNVCPGAYLAFE